MKTAMAVLLCLMVTLGARARAARVAGHLAASLDTGSLAGTKFPVSSSYSARQVTATSDSFISLTSFDFTPRGAEFTRRDIFQGGQVIFRNAVLNNVTASFQVILPPNSPVRNITFGFGGPGII